MKIQDAETLRKMEPKKLVEELNAVIKESFKIRYDVSNGQSKSTHLIRKYRRYIATLKTLLNEK
jgi:ribosomal protein L29